METFHFVMEHIGNCKEGDMSRQSFLKFCTLLFSSSLLPLDAKSSDDSMPALFFGHGSPMNIVLENDFTKMLKGTADTLPKPKAILIISAHWVDNDTRLSSVDNPEIIYDFGGFPQSLYDVSYPVKGSPYIASKLSYPTTNRGLDHGAWSILRHMYPNADIPTMQLSLNKNLSLKQHFELGKSLAVLRKQGILIIGSGGITHNLRYFQHQSTHATPEKSAVVFDTFVKNAIADHQLESLLTPERSGILLQEVHPTIEHYIPLLYIAGIASLGGKNKFIYEGFQNHAFSMRAWLVE